MNGCFYPWLSLFFSLSLFPFVSRRQCNIFPLRSPSAPMSFLCWGFLVIGNRYFIFFARWFFQRGNIQDTVGVDIERNSLRKKRERKREKKKRQKNLMKEKIATLPFSRSTSSFSLRQSFVGHLLSISFVLFADQHSDAYPNSLTIPIEFLPIRAPMATGRKEISRHESRPLCLAVILWADLYILALEKIPLLPVFFSLVARIAFRYSLFPGLLPRRIVFLSPTLIVENVY